jgi:uncharacterized protein (TIGR02001 family)
MKKMKKIYLIAAGLLLMMTFSPALTAQEWSTGLDIYSSYVWRGSKFGSGPAFQPSVEFSAGGFAIGAWGSVNSSTNEASEMDLYLSYGFDFGLSIGLTDYYYPGTEYFDFSTETGAHALELNVGFETGGLSLAGNYFLNEAGGAGSAGGDMYFELGYSFEHVSLFAGAGDGWHTPDGEFGLVNVGIGTSKDIVINETFSLPVSGSVILNPTTEQFFIVVGISL